MIQNEVRIGNKLLMLDLGTKEMNVVDVFKVEEDSINGFIPQCFCSVPLTEEWIEKLGFEYERSYYTHPNSNIFLNGYEDKKLGFYTCLGQWNHLDDQYPIGYIKYVNELQNLYFSLTGKELEINV